MTDENVATPKRVPRWMKVTLVASLAVNLGIAGMVGGAALRAPAEHERLQAPEGISVIARALPMKFQQGLRTALRDQRETLQPDREQMTQLRDRLVVALNAKPFDILAVDQIFEDQRALLTEVTAVGHDHIMQQIQLMNSRDREKFIRNLNGRTHGDQRPPRIAPEAVNRP